LVLCRDENNPAGEVTAKAVEEVFVNGGMVWHLHIGGQVIRTTGEHPFYVNGEGWVACHELQIGDRVATADGRWIQVEDLLNTGVWETLYNVRVADFHTYFVGCDEWGFSVWAHNTCVYRALDKNGTDAGRLAAGLALVSTQSTATNSIESHIGGGTAMRSQWISTTKSKTTALTQFTPNTGVICIDLDKIPPGDITDCSLGIPNCTDPTTNGYAILWQEVIIHKEIPRNAIVGWVRKPGADLTVFDPPAPL
jgi:hypothetical protein